MTKVEEQVIRVNEHLQKWKIFLSETHRKVHSIRISHTDQDMLRIAFQINFSKPAPLEKYPYAKNCSPLWISCKNQICCNDIIFFV